MCRPSSLRLIRNAISRWQVEGPGASRGRGPPPIPCAAAGRDKRVERGHPPYPGLCFLGVCPCRAGVGQTRLPRPPPPAASASAPPPRRVRESASVGSGTSGARIKPVLRYHHRHTVGVTLGAACCAAPASATARVPQFSAGGSVCVAPAIRGHVGGSVLCRPRERYSARAPSRRAQL